MMEEGGKVITTGMITVIAGSYCRRGKSSIALKWLSLLLQNKILPSSKAFCVYSEQLLFCTGWGELCDCPSVDGKVLNSLAPQTTKSSLSCETERSELPQRLGRPTRE
mmetsp:Transcript_16708/g.24080  ORF Transcript_16708/g.24080 Transcript_16708/m.24080 type:complete len:108 (-) Transcript_16708:167-490(-)